MAWSPKASFVEGEVVEERYVVCPRCHRSNRLYERSANGVYRCGACRAALPNPFVAKSSSPSMRTIGIVAASAIALLVTIVLIAGVASGPQATTNQTNASQLPAPSAPETVAPANNQILFDAYPNSASRGELTVDNGTSSHAVAKLIDVATDRKILSFVVGARQKSAIQAIPDGTYELIFAFGDRLYEGTDRFQSPRGSKKFVEHLAFDSRSTADAIHWSRHSVTLHPVLSGNAKTSSISQKEFERY